VWQAVTQMLQKEGLTAANIALFNFKILHFRCVCRMHNEGNATCNVQLLLCVLWQQLQVPAM